VGTSDFVAALSLVMMIVYAVSPPFVSALVLTPSDVLRGFVWQLATWPLANGPSFWTIWNAAVFWFTGRQLERKLGKGRFGWMLLGITVAGSLLAVLLALGFRVDEPILGGLGTMAMIVVLIFIAENPRMPFFFGIPAWVLGLVIVVLPLLSYVGARYWIGLLHFVLSIGAAAIIAKTAGLLSQYAFVPGSRDHAEAAHARAAAQASWSPRAAAHLWPRERGPWPVGRSRAARARGRGDGRPPRQDHGPRPRLPHRPRAQAPRRAPPAAPRPLRRTAAGAVQSAASAVHPAAIAVHHVK